MNLCLAKVTKQRGRVQVEVTEQRVTRQEQWQRTLTARFHPGSRTRGKMIFLINTLHFRIQRVWGIMGQTAAAPGEVARGRVRQQQHINGPENCW